MTTESLTCDGLTQEFVAVNRHEVIALCLAALQDAGARRQVAALLTESAVYAEDRGHPLTGVAHLLDHVDALRDGRLDGRAAPRLRRPAPVVVAADARGGVAQAGFDDGFADLLSIARRFGLAAFTQQGSFTCGPLGWFTERVAGAGLFALATAVAPAALATATGTGPVLGTNPMAWSMPRPGQSPLTVDQSSGSAAQVAVRDAAIRHAPRPGDWTADGALLPFGGHRGANVALLAELLSSMGGGNWSLDAPDWDAGPHSPGVGLFLLVVDTGAVDRAFPARAARHLRRLADRGVRLAGARRAPAGPCLQLRADVIARLRDIAR